MYSNQITIQASDISPELKGELKFRKPKASEVIILSEEQIKLQDENSERESKGLKPKEVSAGLVMVIEELVVKCYISGQSEEGEISKEVFEANFSDLASILYIFNKLVDTQGLVTEKPPLSVA